MAWISLGKLVIFAAGLIFLGSRWRQNSSDSALRKLWTIRIILFILAAFALRLFWSEATHDNALLAFFKHGKLLEIVMLVSLIRTTQEARLALTAFLVSQAIFIVSSWLMVAGVPIPWATSQWETVPQMKYVVFSTYLDQTLMFAGSAAILWHLRRFFPPVPWIAALIAVAALINILFFQEGRTGYLAALTVISLAIMWALPQRLRLAALVMVPVMLIAGVYLGSTQMQDRVSKAVSESQSYAVQGAMESSSGFRLHAWRRSVQAIMQSPLSGHGTGSWTLSVKRIEGADASKVFGEGSTSNPHQEYLLWGVELGIGGILLLLLLIGGVIRDALSFEPPVMRATLSVVAVMGVACLFNSSLYDALIGDYFCVTLGLLLALGIRGKIPDKASLTHPTAETLA
jgi:O-antigen ligase